MSDWNAGWKQFTTEIFATRADAKAYVGRRREAEARNVFHGRIREAPRYRVKALRGRAGYVVEKDYA